MMANDKNPEKLLLELIERLMPTALQITLDKNEEPTFKNILHVIAICGHEWFQALTATGTFAHLSAGWMYVRHTNTTISDNSAMDKAVIHSLQILSSFPSGVQLSDLFAYISAAFRFPQLLSRDEIVEKVQCSVAALKAWGKVLVQDGCYKLPISNELPPDEKCSAIEFSSTEKCSAINLSLDEKCSAFEIETEATSCESPAASTSLLPDEEVKHEHKHEHENEIDLKHDNDITSRLRILAEDAEESAAVEPREIAEKVMDFEEDIFDTPNTSAETENHNEDIIPVLESDQVSITSAPGSPLPSQQQKTALLPHPQVYGAHRPPPFLYANNRYRIYINCKMLSPKKAFLGHGDPIRQMFETNSLRYMKVYVPPMKPFLAFVEVETTQDGWRAIEILDGSLFDGGAFRLIVQWATPTTRDLQDLRDAELQRAGSTDRDRRSPATSRKRHSRSPSVNSRTKRDRSQTRSHSRRSR